MYAYSRRLNCICSITVLLLAESTGLVRGTHTRKMPTCFPGQWEAELVRCSRHCSVGVYSIPGRRRESENVSADSGGLLDRQLLAGELETGREWMEGGSGEREGVEGGRGE